MPLQEIPGDLQGTTGAVEEIQIVPASPGTVVSIARILYGTNAAGPIKVPVNADKTSFDLTILPGSNLLQVVLFSPNKSDSGAVAQQTAGGVVTTLADDIEFLNGLAVWTPEILGI
jgi:hypothetical protein